MPLELISSLQIDPMSVLHWMLAISITLLVLDLFIQTEFISWVSLLIFAGYISLLCDTHLDLPIQWTVLVFIAGLALSIALYYALWSKLQLLIKKTLLRKATPEYLNRAAGEIAIYRLMEGASFVEWNGELWSAQAEKSNDEFSEREQVKISRQVSGKLFIRKINNNQTNQ